MKHASVTVKKVALKIAKPHPENPRIHPPKGSPEYEALRKSLTADYFDPLVWNKRNGCLVSGHYRRIVLIDEGFTHADMVVVDWDEPTHRGRMIAANELLGQFDNEKLNELLSQITDNQTAQSLTGLTDDRLQELLDACKPETQESAVDAEPQSDRAEELQAKWGVEMGQVWQLGEHRIMCGDSTLKENVETLLSGDKPNLMVTDPPYGVEYDANWRNEAAAAGLIGQKKSTRAIGKVENDDKMDWSLAWSLFHGNVAYVWHADRHASEVQRSIESSGFEIRCQIIWAKNNFAIGRGDYHWQHEPCWYAVRSGKPGSWSGDRSQTTLWHIDKPIKSETGHSTQKPIECMARPIRNNSSSGDLVYEPFSGSGTTLIACERLGRRCRAMEISPAYVAVALQRWADATGKTPVKL